MPGAKQAVWRELNMKKISLSVMALSLLITANVYAQFTPSEPKTKAAQEMPGNLKIPALANTPLTPEVKELIQRLLEANGVRESLNRIFEDIISRAPAEQQKYLRDVLKTDEIIETISPVYAKYFTPEELKEMIEFYKSPIGTKNLVLTPKLMTEVMQLAGQYFEAHMKDMPKAPEEAPAPAKKEK